MNLLFNQQPQSTLDRSVLMARKNQVMKVRPLFNRNPQSIQTTLKLKGLKNQATKVRLLSKLRILFIPQLSEVSQRLKRKPLIILSKLLLMITNMWMKKLLIKRAKKVAKKSIKFTKPLMVLRLVSRLLCQVRLLRCHNLEKSVVAASL